MFLSKLFAPKPKLVHHDKKQIKKVIKSDLPLHRRVLFHPVTLFFLLCLGVLIIGWTYRVVADFYTVTAEVQAAILTQPAIITSPPDGYDTSTELLTVSGTCPYGSYVNLYDNAVFSGVAWCAQGGTFSIQMDLSVGQNNLTVQDYNITNDPGSTASGITVIYGPIVPSPSSPASPTSPTQTTKTIVPELTYPPLDLRSTFLFQTFLERHQFSWKIDVSGGKAPYIINVTWGDDQTTAYSLTKAGSINITHVYNKGGYYTILVEGVDSVGDQKILQLAALILYPGQSGFTLTPNTRPPPSGGLSIGKLFSNNKWLIVAWPSYLIILLMATSFWLGERREYDKLLRDQF
jgi:hypothetical protein